MKNSINTSTPSLYRQLVQRTAQVGFAALLLLAPTVALAQTEVQPVAATGTQPASLPAVLKASQLKGILPNASSEIYLALEPAERDGSITISLAYGPDSRAADGKVNFYVVSEEGLRDIRSGAHPSEVSIASGSPKSGSDNDNLLYATFTATGRNAYTVIVYSDASVAADYTVDVSNAMLIDASGQTQAPASSTPAQTMGEASPVTAASPLTIPLTTTMATSNPTVLGEQGIQANQQSYYTVMPTERDGEVTVVFDILTAGVSEADGRLNFYVFDDNGLQALHAGESPFSANLAAGTLVESGSETGQLRATFTPTVRKPYVVMVSNLSGAAATYTLQVRGGVISQ